MCACARVCGVSCGFGSVCVVCHVIWGVCVCGVSCDLGSVCVWCVM